MQAKGPKCRKCQKFGHIARDCKDSNARKGETFCAVLSTFKKADASDWIFDSAAYTYMTSDESLLEELGEGNGKVVAANGGTMDIVASGKAKLWPICSGQECVAVSDVQLIPELTANLLSISKIVEKGYSVTFRDTGCEVYNGDGVVVATGKHENNQFKLEQTQRRGNVMVCGATRDGVGSLELWHKRLGHLSVRNVEILANGVVPTTPFVAATLPIVVIPMVLR